MHQKILILLERKNLSKKKLKRGKKRILIVEVVKNKFFQILFPNYS